jgi:hypothetical protein
MRAATTSARQPVVAFVHLPARRQHHVVQDHLVQFVDDLAFHLVAHDLIDLARIGERQLQHAHGQHLAGQRQVGRGPAGQLGDALAQGLVLPLGQGTLVRGDAFFKGRDDPGVAESDVEDGELHRPRAKVDSGDGVGHGASIPPANTG